MASINSCNEFTKKIVVRPLILCKSDSYQNIGTFEEPQVWLIYGIDLTNKRNDPCILLQYTAVETIWSCACHVQNGKRTQIARDGSFFFSWHAHPFEVVSVPREVSSRASIVRSFLLVAR